MNAPKPHPVVATLITAPAPWDVWLAAAPVLVVLPLPVVLPELLDPVLAPLPVGAVTPVPVPVSALVGLEGVPEVVK
jgi:hypothetical protein